MIQVYMFLMIAGIVGGVGYGGYMYYQDTQERLAQYAANQAKLEEAVKTSEATIEKMAGDIQRQMELNNKLNDSLNRATEQQDKLRRTLSKHNLTKDALTDPENLEKRMNNATVKVWSRIESLTGNSNRSELLKSTSGKDSNENRVSGKDNSTSPESKTNKPE